MPCDDELQNKKDELLNENWEAGRPASNSPPPVYYWFGLTFGFG